MIWIVLGVLWVLGCSFFWALCYAGALADRRDASYRRANAIAVDVLDWDVDEFNEQIVQIAPLEKAKT